MSINFTSEPEKYSIGSNIDNELRRLARALELGRDGTFTLLLIDDLAQIDDWISILRSYFNEEPLFIDINYDARTLGIADQVSYVTTNHDFLEKQQHLGYPLTILVIRDVDSLTSQQRNDLAHSLNFSRSRLSGIAYPMMFVVDEEMWTTLINEAPDFYRFVGIRADLLGKLPPRISSTPASAESVEHRYRMALNHTYRLVEFRGIPTINKPIPLPLTEFYVPLEGDIVVNVNSASVSPLEASMDEGRADAEVLDRGKDVIETRLVKDDSNDLAITSDAFTEVIRQVQAGDINAFSMIYNRFADRIFRYLFALNANVDIAEELAQNLWIRVLDRLPGLRAEPNMSEGSFTVWLYQLARIISVEETQRSRKNLVMESLTDNIQSRDESPEDVTIQHETTERLRTAIEQLPQSQRDIIILRFIEGRSTAEVARLTSKSPASVLALQYRAFRALGQVLRSQ